MPERRLSGDVDESDHVSSLLNPLLKIERSQLKAETRRYTNEITRYHTPGEWQKIDSVLDDIGDYAAIDNVSSTREAVRNSLPPPPQPPPFQNTNAKLTTARPQMAKLARENGKFVMQHIVLGDTYMHIALRLYAIECCMLLIEGGINPCLVNSLGEGAPDLIHAVHIGR